LSRSGFQCPDIRVTRLVSIAAQKFIGEIASDALQ
jgi:transcription initiation factor TFIID subunit 10